MPELVDSMVTVWVKLTGRGGALEVPVLPSVWNRCRGICDLLAMDTGKPAEYYYPLYLEWQGVIDCADGLCYASATCTITPDDDPP